MSLVLLSGGLDSTVLLAAASFGRTADVEAISFDYGQRHRKELDAAAMVAKHYQVKHQIIDLSGLGANLPSALTGHSDIPTGAYDERTMHATVVPNRNAILLSVAAGVAAGRGLSTVMTAVHSGDHALYPDCRSEFIDAISAATMLSCGVQVVAPFAHMSKASIVDIGRTLDVPFGMTWSCYQGGDKPCGSCGTCIEREDALA